MHYAPLFFHPENLSLDKSPGLTKGQGLALTLASHSLCWLLEKDHNGNRVFSRACSNRMKGNGFKLKGGQFKLDVRKIVFTARGLKTDTVAQRGSGCPIPCNIQGPKQPGLVEDQLTNGCSSYSSFECVRKTWLRGR